MKKMKKILFVSICTLMVAALAACGSGSSSNGSSETAAEAVSDTDASDVSDEDEPDVIEEEDAEDYVRIEVADYDPDDYVTLGDYKGLDIELQKYEVTDEDVEEEIESLLEEFAEEVDKESAEDGDYLSLSYKLTVDGADIEGTEEEDVLMQLGEEDLYAEFDEALRGAKAGDQVNIPIVLDDTYGDEYTDKEGIYVVNVDQVYAINTPELTDDFVKENTEYDSVDAYKEGIRANLSKSFEIESRSEAGESAIKAAAEKAEFKGFPEDLYNRTKQETEESYDYYSAMFGTDRDALISDEDLEAEVLDEVNNQILVKAVAKAENLVLDEEAYQTYLADNLAVYGYSDPASLEADYTREVLEEEALRDMVRNFLIENGNVTEVEPVDSDEEYYDDEDLDEEYYDDGDDASDEEYDDEDEYSDEDDEDLADEDEDEDDDVLIVLDEEDDLDDEEE